MKSSMKNDSSVKILELSKSDANIKILPTAEKEPDQRESVPMTPLKEDNYRLKSKVNLKIDTPKMPIGKA